MRYYRIGSLQFYYPDTVSMAFNKSIVKMYRSDLKAASCTVRSGDVSQKMSADARNGKAIIDITACVQSCFDDNDFTFYYDEGVEKSTLGRNVSLTFGYELTDGTSQEAVHEVGVFYIWGALMRGETLGARRKYVAWENYPFCMSLWVLGAGGVVWRNNASGDTAQKDITEQGMFVCNALEYLREGDRITVSDKGAVMGLTTFDKSYSYSFQTASVSEGSVIADIEVRADMDGVYLRWIDRHGMWRHWLFASGEESRAVTADGEFVRNQLENQAETYGMLGNNGRRHTYSREDTVELCAPLVDSETFDILQDLTTSPVVDMYIGKEDDDYAAWQSVTIKDGTYQKTTADLQDFVCNMVRNDINIQRL